MTASVPLKTPNRHQEGFTLIELLVSMALVVILSTIAMFTLIALNRATIASHQSVDNLIGATQAVERMTMTIRGASRHPDRINKQHSPFISLGRNHLYLWTMTGQPLGQERYKAVPKAVAYRTMTYIEWCAKSSPSDVTPCINLPHGDEEYVLVQFDFNLPTPETATADELSAPELNPSQALAGRDVRLTNPVLLARYLVSPDIFTYISATANNPIDSKNRCYEDITHLYDDTKLSDLDTYPGPTTRGGTAASYAAVDYVEISVNVKRPSDDLHTSRGLVTQVARVPESSVGEFTQYAMEAPKAGDPQTVLKVGECKHVQLGRRSATDTFATEVPYVTPRK